MVGYCMIGMCLVVLHALTSILGLRRSARVLGLCYVVVKVGDKKSDSKLHLSLFRYTNNVNIFYFTQIGTGIHR
jgi:hypothetical protein